VVRHDRNKWQFLQDADISGGWVATVGAQKIGIAR